MEKTGVHAKTQESKQRCSNSCKRSSGNNSSGSPAERVLQFQRTAGNQAVQRLIKSRALQAKLRVSQPNDSYEQEADRVAEQVMRMPDFALQSKCTKCDKEEKEFLQAKESPRQMSVTHGHDEQPIVQRKCSLWDESGNRLYRKQEAQKIQSELKPANSSEINSQTSSKIISLNGSGQPLPQGVKDKFGSHFGQDFSGVRIHKDGHAAKLAGAIGAKAFTHGQNIVFGQGEYAPESLAGQRLLAHELAHVVQQGSMAKTPDNMFLHVFRNLVMSPGGPGGPDPCLDIIQAIIELLNEVAKRINDALDDHFDLYKFRPNSNPNHPEAGTWDGHRDRFYYDRDRLRHKIAEWESNDNCRGYKLSREHQEELEEAKEFKEKEFPTKPVRSMREAPGEESESVWDKLRKYLPEFIVVALMAIGAYYAAVAIAACFATGACEFAIALAGLGFLLVVGITAALKAAGVRDTGEA